MSMKADYTVKEDTLYINKNLEEISNQKLPSSFVKHIIIPDGVKKINDYAFMLFEAESVKIPDSVETVGNHAFDGCKNLKEIKLFNAKTISGNAFSLCTSLQKLYISENTTLELSYHEIQNQMFSGDTALYVKTKNEPINFNKFIKYDYDEESVVLQTYSTSSVFFSCEDIYFVLEFIRNPNPNNLTSIKNHFIQIMLMSAFDSFDRINNYHNLLNEEIVMDYIARTNDYDTLDYIINHKYINSEQIEVGLDLARDYENHEMFVILTQTKKEMGGYDIEDERFDL